MPLRKKKALQIPAVDFTEAAYEENLQQNTNPVEHYEQVADTHGQWGFWDRGWVFSWQPYFAETRAAHIENWGAGLFFGVPPAAGDSPRLPEHSKKIMRAMKATRAVKRITFNPGETLYAHVPKLNENEVLAPNSLALIFDIHVSGGHANNFLVQNVSRALVDKLVVKFAGTTLEETVGHDIYNTFSDPFLPGEKRDNMVPEGIQSEDLCKIRSNSGDKKTSGVDAEKKLKEVYGTKYRINLDHQILTDHGIFYPQALYNDLTFEVTLAPASQVVKGTEPD